METMKVMEIMEGNENAVDLTETADFAETAVKLSEDQDIIGKVLAKEQLSLLIRRYPELKALKESIYKAYSILSECFLYGGKLLVCGNGGSCADSEHIVGELMKGFCKKRPIPKALKERLCEMDPMNGPHLSENLECALPAIALASHNALYTAYANDKDPDLIFAQQVLGYGKKGDVLMGITTSGNSSNVLYALLTARSIGMRTIVLTGKDGGNAKALADVALVVPANETYQIQEYHLPIYHALCLMLEDTFFEE